jgi:hypothetical protein
LFLSGNDDGSKRALRGLLESFGWRDILDLGDIGTARATESYLPLWLAVWKTLGTVAFNVKVIRWKRLAVDLELSGKQRPHPNRFHTPDGAIRRAHRRRRRFCDAWQLRRGRDSVRTKTC